MRTLRIPPWIIHLMLASMGLAAGGAESLSAPPALPPGSTSSGDREARGWDPAARQREIQRYIAERKTLTKLGPDGKPVATLRIQPYEWFATEPAGLIGAEMMPVILLRILPDLAVEYGEKDPEDRLQPLFGEPSDAFAKFGFWRDPRPEAKDRPLPLGFAWTAGHKDDPIPLSLSIRTCAGCHTGRVRLDDGSIRVLVGSPNTEILLHQYDIAVATFFTKHLADDKIKDFEQAILKLVDAKHTADPNYFFKDSEGYDAAEEGRQVGVFRAALGLPPERRGILASIKRAAGLKLLGVANLERVAYSKRNSPRLAAGPPGLIDSSGLGIAAFLAPAKLDAKDVLFAGATKNDVPAVWNQWTRKQWQWDGNIRDVLARNLVAALGLVGLPEEMDITANALASEFIDGLPPAPYPFAITRDDDQLRRGRALFEANCIACHQDDQHRGDGRPLPIFNDLGTDMNRARVVRPAGYEIIKKALVACYQPADLRFKLNDQEFAPNRDVDGNALLVKRFTPETRGYVAPPLDGLWARAPTCTMARCRP